MPPVITAVVVTEYNTIHILSMDIVINYLGDLTVVSFSMENITHFNPHVLVHCQLVSARCGHHDFQLQRAIQTLLRIRDYDIMHVENVGHRLVFERTADPALVVNHFGEEAFNERRAERDGEDCCTKGVVRWGRRLVIGEDKPFTSLAQIGAQI